jgi:hypothetical protein
MPGAEAHLGGGTPRDFGPCGDVLQFNKPLLFKQFEKRYTYFCPVIPTVRECLLVPFYVDGVAVGTVWAITHDAPHNTNSSTRPNGPQFDREDLRRLEVLGRFATAAYQVWTNKVPHEERPGELPLVTTTKSASARAPQR